MPDGQWADDQSIDNDAVLWRGATPNLIELDPVSGKVIPREGAFRTQVVSMNVASETTVAVMHAKCPTWRLWAVTAKQIRDAGCIIVRDPEPDDQSHVNVLRGDRPGERLTGGMANRLRRNGYWEDEGPPAG